MAKALHGTIGLSGSYFGKGRLCEGEGGGYSGGGGRNWPCMWPRLPKEEETKLAERRKGRRALGLT